MSITVAVRVLVCTLLITALMACGIRAQPRSYNLSGYSAVYKKGHADGCSSTGWQQRRDEQLYRNDADYMMGWNDGQSTCSRQK